MEDLAGKVGVKWQTIQQWENGTTAPRRTRLAKVAAALDTTLENLLAGLIDYIPSAAIAPRSSRVAELEARPYLGRNNVIRQIISLLEPLPDVALGEVLRCAKEVAREHETNANTEKRG